MEQSPQQTSTGSTTSSIGRSALGGLPPPVLAAVIVAIAVVVGLGSLAQAGLLAPQFRNTGGGSGEGALPAGASHVGFQVLKNVSWRSWTITSIEAPELPAGDVSVFVKPAGALGTLPQQVEAAATDAAPTRLPLTVSAGDEVVVLQYQKVATCAEPSMTPGPVQTRASLGIATPLGQRWIRATLFRGAPAATPGAPCPLAP